MKPVPEGLAERLQEWLKANALEMARELRDAGWEEDERGLWRKKRGEPGQHLLDAHVLAHSRTGDEREEG